MLTARRGIMRSNPSMAVSRVAARVTLQAVCHPAGLKLPRGNQGKVALLPVAPLQLGIVTGGGVSGDQWTTPDKQRVAAPAAPPRIPPLDSAGWPPPHCEGFQSRSQVRNHLYISHALPPPIARHLPQHPKGPPRCSRTSGPALQMATRWTISRRGRGLPIQFSTKCCTHLTLQRRSRTAVASLPLLLDKETGQI